MDAPAGLCSSGEGGRDVLELTEDVLLVERDNFLNGWNGLPLITSPIAIEGNGHAIARAEGADGFRILYVLPSGDLALHDVEIRNGLPGAITNEGTTSTWNASLVDNEEASNGGGLENVATAVIVNSTISGNSASLRGAGISSSHLLWLIDSSVTDNLGDSFNSYGGGLANWGGGSARVVRTTISGNYAGVGGGGVSNGDNYAQATLEIADSTIADNSTGTDFEYYDDAGGGGIMNNGGLVAVSNSTISGNLASGSLFGDKEGGALHNKSDGLVALTNSTLSGNRAITNGRRVGDSIHNDDLQSVTTISNTLVADGELHCTGNGTLIDGGGNFDDDGTCAGDPIVAGIDYDPLLGDHGGPTRTHPLLPGSVAVDTTADCGLARDQRGFARGDGLCDSGSYELDGEPGLAVGLTGICPGEVQLTVSGAQPGAEVAFVTSEAIGVVEKPLPPCEGLELYLETPTLTTVLVADANGTVVASPDLPDSACGLFVQVVDKVACSAAPVVRLPRATR